MLPACCLPLWGREGVTLPAAAENKRITQKKRISTKPKKDYLDLLFPTRFFKTRCFF